MVIDDSKDEAPVLRRVQVRELREHERSEFDRRLEEQHSLACSDLVGGRRRAEHEAVVLVYNAFGEGQLDRSVGFTELVAEAQEAGLFIRLIPEEGEPDRPAKSAFSKLLARYNKCTVGKHYFLVEGKGHQRRFRVRKLGS